MNKRLTLAATARFAVLHLQAVFDHVESATLDSRRLTAHHEPDMPHDPSHSGTYGYSDDDQLIADLIAEALQEHYKARK